MQKVIRWAGMILMLSVMSGLAVVVAVPLGCFSFGTAYIIGLFIQGRNDGSLSVFLFLVLFWVSGWGSGEFFTHCQRDERFFVATVLLALAGGSLVGFACTELPTFIVFLMAAAFVLGVWCAVIPAPRQQKEKS